MTAVSPVNAHNESRIDTDEKPSGDLSLTLFGYLRTNSDIRKSKFNNFLQDRYIVACLGYDGSVTVYELPFEEVKTNAFNIRHNLGRSDCNAQSDLFLKKNVSVVNDSLPGARRKND